jgi:AcrR family transcriptional regulator
MASRRDRTHARLVDAGLRLFATHGYDATTVAQVAAAAGVTEMTFYRHFPAKQDLVLDDPYDPLIASAIDQQAPDLDPLTRVVRTFRAAWQNLPESGTDDVRARIEIIVATPSLRAGTWATTERTQQMLVDHLEASGTDRIAAVVATSVVLAALNAALLEWGRAGRGPLGPVISAALDVLEVRHG